uniref:polynucleotide adenylyltransferase n=1 Tax=Globodera pallida TaxID=36090 RepID=A0A183CIH1_GLOPA
MPKFGEQNASVSAIVHLLDVGIYANKIGHQLKAIHQIEGIWSEIGIQQSDLVNIERKWAQLKELKLSSKIRWAHLEGFLHELLKQLLALLDQKNAIDSPRHGSSSSNSSSSSGGVNFEKEIRGLKNELHLRNLAVAVADNSSDCSLLFWTAFGAEKPKNNSTPLLSLLLFSDSDSIKTHLSQYVKMVKKENSQRKIDNQLYSQYRNNKNFSKFVVPKMATNFVPSQLEQISEFWQPINFGEDRFKQSDIDNLAKESSKVNCHISDKCLLRPTGEPTMLETVCIMPQQFDVSLSFFGGSFNCDFDNREMCQDQSLYCKLCNNANVLSLTKINKDQFTPVPQLQFTFKNCQFTILAIIVPSLEGDHHRRKTEPFDGQQIDKISQKFGDEIEKLIRADHLFDEGQFRSSQKVNSDTIELLTNSLIHAEPREIPKIMEQIFMFDEFDEMLVKGRQIAIRQRASVTDLLATLKVFANFGNDLKIAEFIADTAAFGQTRYESNNSMNKFCLTLAYLELWANSNHLDDAKLGYLDFNILTIMVTKIFLLYPNATVPWLIEKFFITYSTWKWPLPIQLAEIDFDRKGEFLSWTPGREWFTKRQFSPKTLLKTIRAEMAMAIITPTFPEHNLAQNANLSSIKCIQNQMAKALAKIRNENVQNALIVPLESQKFSNMYEHFIVVTCTASNYRIDNLANFVSKRLGHELAEIIENPLEKWIKFSHICSRCISLGECSEKSSPKSPATSNCKKIWLIGIELNESLKELSKFKSKLRANLKKKFDEKIKSDFDGGFVEIESEYVDERETLQKFW